MADNKLKVDNGGNNYGSISLGQKAPKEGNMKFFDQLRSRLNYKKLQEENAPKQKTMSVFSLFRYADKKDKIALVIGVIAAISQGILMSYVYVLLSDLFITIMTESTSIIGTVNKQRYWKHILVFMYTGAASFILGYVKAICFTMATERQMGRIRTVLFRTILAKPISYYDTHSSGQFTSMLSRIADAMGMKMAMNIMTMAHLLSSIIIAIINTWEVSLVIICLTPPIYFAGSMTGKHMTHLTHSELVAYSKADAIVQEVISSIRTVFAYNAQDNEAQRYADTMPATRDFALKKARIGGLQVGLNNLLTYTIYAACVIISAVLVNSGRASIAQVVTAFFTAGRSSFYAITILPQFHVINEGKGAAQRIWDFIDEFETEPNTQKNISISLASGITFNNVSFAYPARPEVTVLHGLSFHVNPGETVAIVGSSGSGKSTCVQLLLRFYDPVDGFIRVNNDCRIDEINVESYRQQIAVVSQEPVLFSTTIRENIQYGNDLVTFAEIEDAARQANAHDFIMSLPKAYDTIVGQRGTQLSGGQKQRICLARALVRRAPILLLDEATSALDSRSEAIVQQALDQACHDNRRITLMITHRLSTARHADRIIVMRQGTVVEQGTHQELMTIEKGVYAAMIARQEKYVDDDNTGEVVNEQDNNPSISSISQSLHKKNKELVQDEDNQHCDQDDDEIEGKPLSTSAAAWQLTRGVRLWLLCGCVASMITAFRTVAWTFLLSRMLMGFTETTNKARFNTLFVVAFGFLVVGIVTCATCWLSYYFFGRASALLTEQLRLRTFTTLLQQEIGWFDRKENNPGHLSKLLESDAATIQAGINAILSTIVELVATLASGLILSAILVGMKITFVYIGIITVLTIVCILYTMISKYSTNKKRQVLQDLNAMAIESTQNIRTVLELNKQQSFSDRYAALADESVRIPLRYMHIIGMFCAIEMSRIFFLLAILLVLVVHFAMEGMNVQKLLLIVTFGSFTNQTYTMVYIALPKLGSSLAVAKYFTQFFQRKPRIPLNPKTSHASPLQLDQIEFDRVEFSYPTRPTLRVLNNLNLILKNGQSIALVGTTGCGKSTALALIERFYDVTDGVIRINSKNIRETSLRQLRSCIAYVGQEPVLFNISIRDNIAYGSDQSSLTMSDIIEAATKANIHSFIEALPEGYDTSIGIFGARISGGQRQRIAIARAFARKPKLLLMDEPTSALDIENEQIIQEALQNNTQNLTSVTVAHRLSTIRHVDMIYVMRRGRIVENGTHDELMTRSNGVYAQLYNQFIQSTNA